jgi:hypothetical protein
MAEPESPNAAHLVISSFRQNNISISIISSTPEKVVALDRAVVPLPQAELPVVIEQGIVTGKQNEAFTLILRQLTRRIGEIPVNLVEQIRQLPIETLENLAEVLLDFQTEADLRDFLRELI